MNKEEIRMDVMNKEEIRININDYNSLKIEEIKKYDYLVKLIEDQTKNFIEESEKEIKEINLQKKKIIEEAYTILNKKLDQYDRYEDSSYDFFQLHYQY